MITMKTSKIFVAGILILLAMAASTGCGSSSSGTITTPTSAIAAINKNSVIMTGITFQPAEITIHKGETITWTNKNADDRDVIGSSFQSDLIEKDGTYSQEFNQAGIYNYTCSVNTSMMGRIIVK
jgi:plastocyanin